MKLRELKTKIVGTFFYYLAYVVLQLMAAFFWRMTIKGKQNIPKTGAFLLCPVHRSNLDGPITCIFTTRRMKYLAKIEIFKIEWLGNIFKAMGAIGVDRGAPDRKALHDCLKVVNAGHPLVLFPEGARCDGPEVQDLQVGAAYIALKANIPVIPVGIEGSEASQPRGKKLLRPVKIRIVIGEPILFPQSATGRAARSEVSEGTALLKRRLQEVFDEAMTHK